MEGDYEDLADKPCECAVEQGEQVKKGPGRPRGGPFRPDPSGILKKTDYSSYYGAAEGLRDSWKPKRSINQRRWEPSVKDLFYNKANPEGEDE